MNIIKARYEILSPADLKGAGKQQIYESIERAGRTCYKSEGSIREGSAARFVAALVRRHHEAMLEHASLTVRFTVDRGITHELVRHRVASFAQESTRYCNYSSDKFGNSVTFIDLRPGMMEDPVVSALPEDAFEAVVTEWLAACEDAQRHYLAMLDKGATPQIARSVLPNCVKSEIVVTANIREWRHILSLRAVGSTGAPHPQMTEIMVPLLRELAEALPECFGDLLPREGDEPK